ncbi:MAG TPA: septum formation initiator family protein [Candidatus Cloacimonadota bacterium]|nr:septum formation initiator family protein [Candidatus Cloacimonadota bacterium]HPS38114.1 septum formation initiator family protein [Candidatus Cloacimonadota bacterium]
MKQDRANNPRIANIVFWAVIIFMVSWITLWGGNSFLKTHQLHRSLKNMEAQVNVLKAQNDSLKAENERLRTSPEAAEKAARERFGLTKPGEKVFRFVPAADPPKEDTK